jgi:hypothetical protein
MPAVFAGMLLGFNGAGFGRWVRFVALTTLREKLIKIGAKVVSGDWYVVFQMAVVAVPRWLFRAILERIRRLKPHRQCSNGQDRRRNHTERMISEISGKYATIFGTFC